SNAGTRIGFRNCHGTSHQRYWYETVSMAFVPILFADVRYAYTEAGCLHLALRNVGFTIINKRFHLIRGLYLQHEIPNTQCSSFFVGDFSCSCRTGSGPWLWWQPSSRGPICAPCPARQFA